jgi:hypothetical protein
MTTMSNRTIYEALRAAGLTHAGACGLMGNMRAESGMVSNIAQRGMTKLTDAQYTAAADNGLLDFTRDAVGYGLCQWTYPTRKAALLAYARARGVSVGNEEMQVQFCLRELQSDYPGVWRVLCSSADIYECAQIVCVQYERPAVNNVQARAEFARNFAAQFEGEPEPSPEPTPAQPTTKTTADVTLLQTAMALGECWPLDKIDGLNTPEWRAAFRSYAEIVAGGGYQWARSQSPCRR